MRHERSGTPIAPVARYRLNVPNTLPRGDVVDGSPGMELAMGKKHDSYIDIAMIATGVAMVACGGADGGVVTTDPVPAGASPNTPAPADPGAVGSLLRGQDSIA